MRGIVTMADENYMPNALALAKSVLEFTDYPIAIFQTGHRDPLHHRLMYSRTAPDIIKYHNNFCYMKAKCCLLSGFDSGWWIDADAVITSRFKELEPPTGNVPAFPVHKNSPAISPQVARYFGNPKGDYFHASVFGFGNESKPFLELFDIIVRGRPDEAEENRGFDEHWWNCMLRRWGAKPEPIDIVTNYDDAIVMPHIYHGIKNSNEILKKVGL